MFLVSSCSCLSPIYWSHVLSWEWRCSWSSADRRCSNYIWVINNLIAHKGASYIRGLTVYGIVHNQYFCALFAWKYICLGTRRLHIWLIVSGTAHRKCALNFILQCHVLWTRSQHMRADITSTHINRPCLTFTGKLSGVYCEENWQCYNGTAFIPQWTLVFFFQRVCQLCNQIHIPHSQLQPEVKRKLFWPARHLSYCTHCSDVQENKSLGWCHMSVIDSQITSKPWLNCLFHSLLRLTTMKTPKLKNTLGFAR